VLRGQVGTVVLCHDPDTVEVEFCDDQGRTVAILPLAVKRLLQLRPPMILARPRIKPKLVDDRKRTS